MKTTAKTGVLRHSDARELAAELTGALDAGDVTLDLAAVEQVDTGILQVLISASALADRTGRRLHLHMPEGSAVWSAAQALALPPFGLPVSGLSAQDSNKGQSL
ncbi:STAS domain-containing protein [Paragemmobacter straminiformis]|uniref:STAS domain-containing protein n=1 Tax=Paragemmobacter straminiformis TaxID=2045119 RepID=A0A842I355_9RHOB|nr:STAS domain-containing protein [Gemmobacter straminiformis]MBC2834139.1 STAS domain-containing protein [Gemmobacter straminiformis]